jgi:BlaI family penicillinase repressor
MSENVRPAMSDAERAVLKTLWDHGPAPVRDVWRRLEEQGQGWTRSTVITLLQRLEKKGYVASDTSGHAFVFRAAVSREEVVQERVAELAAELTDGEALPLVLAFARQSKFTPSEIEEFRRTIDELEANRRAKAGDKRSGKSRRANG